MDAPRGDEFIVKIDGANLPAKVHAEIASKIQAVVIRELANLDFRGDLVARLPRGEEWNGIWVGPPPKGSFGTSYSVKAQQDVK